MNAFANAWADLPATAQDAAILAVLLAPGLLLGLLVVAGQRPFALAGAILWRFRLPSLLFTGLIAVSVAIGTGLIAQERALREGTARIADPFPLIVAAPGSEITMLLATVFLQPSDVPLLSGAVFDAISRDERVAIAAPIGFGDNVEGAPMIGTTPEFIAHLGGDLAEGRMVADHFEAVAGASVPLELGAAFTPQHGMKAREEHHHDDHEDDDHHHHEDEFMLVGRMAPTGSPWDRAILVPIEAVWEIHGLANGHAPERAEQLGPPFDPDYFPGTLAVLVTANELFQTYALQAAWQSEETMAFLPATVLSGLYALLGDVRQAMSLLAVATQVLVGAGVLVGLAILARLFARQMALLRAIGAPARFVFAVVWCHAAVLVVAGALAGLGVGYLAARTISAVLSRRTDILLTAGLGWPELHLVAAFVSLTLAVALLPAFASLSRSAVADLRG